MGRIPCNPKVCIQCQDLVAGRPCGYPTNYLILLNHLQNKGRQTTDVSQMLGFLTSRAGCGGQKVQLSALQFNYTEPYFLCSTPSLVKPAHYFVTSYFDRLGSLGFFVLFCFYFKERKQPLQVCFLYNRGLAESQLCPDPI